MKKSYLLLLLFLSLTNCTKEEKSTQIAINYELTDDVSPVKVKLSVDENVSQSEWILDDGIPQQSEDAQNNLELVFTNPGMSNVKFNATGVNGEKYFGNQDIEIPQVANRLLIYGFNFRNNYNFGVTDNNLIFKFNYYNGSAYRNYSTTISANTFENNTSVTFNVPVEIDISGFDMIQGDNLFIFFTIEGAETHKSYFRINFFVKDWYYNHRLYAPDYIYLDNLQGSNERIYLDTDWTRR